jgi:hypothetical protein
MGRAHAAVVHRGAAVFKTSSPRQRSLVAKDFIGQIALPAAAVQLLLEFWERELPKNSLRFFFAKIKT